MTAVTSVDVVIDSVKTPRSTYRQEQADATRVRIADAAQRLFARDGYSATAMEGIAREAGVGTRTVYAVFGAKREILSVICERWLERAGARELAREVLDTVDPVERLRRSAGWLTTLYSTDFDVARVLDAAVDEDAETRELLAAKLRGRNRVMDQMISSVEPELSVPLAEAQSMFRAFAAVGVYGALVVDAGWTPARFESWLADALVHQLMSASAVPDPAHP
ncbi:TetR/AcrR family transcriptional regulator [Microbacterium allomyrinae]|uniref:TetR/AcrR family transcriptional regulator n=1 Tax=Microbacterium allomyrinae TaxID=2830666 RepID=UPI001E5B92F6|nr:TetR/AcrR family transcriptional regulator [Microbacterium allomyrinae]